MPSSSHVRIIFVAWVFHSLAISTIFQTFFTSFLVDPGLQKQIMNLNELVESKMDYAISPFVRKLKGRMQEMNKAIEKERECKNHNACVQRIIDTRNFALFENTKAVNQYLSTVKNRKYVCVMNNIDVTPVRVIALISRKTMILDEFNKFVTKMFESGISTKADKEIWPSYNLVDDDEEKYFVFTVSHLLVAFYALILGHSVGFVVFLLELLHHAHSTHHRQCSMIK
jgi:hypothetical protein